MANTKNSAYLNKRSYKAIKCLTLLLLPIAASLYFVFSYVFDFLPNGQMVVGIFVMVIAVLGIILTLSTRSYLSAKRYDGELVITKKEGKSLFSLEVNRDPRELADMEAVVFKVERT